jgi:SH3-like domain-containing protein
MQKLIIFIFIFLNIFTNCIAIENNYFLSLKNNKVNVRYGPGFDYPIKYIYKKKYLPVKIIDKKENFRRIIDLKKNSGWIHISQLKKSKSLITTSKKILFKKPTKYSEPLAKLEEGRLLIFKKCVKDWCNVKSDQYSGWINKSNIWGISK